MKKLLTLCAAVALGISATAYADALNTVDVTNLVETSTEAWHATGTYSAKVNTADGRNVNMTEHYYSNTDVNPGEKPLYQTVTLDNGKYYITLYATALNAWKGDSWLNQESSDVVRLYANGGATIATTPVKAAKASDYTVPGEYSLEVEVTGGNLEIGMENLVQNQVEWFTIQIKSLAREASAEEALAAARQVAEAALDNEAYANITGMERTSLQDAVTNATTAAELNSALAAFIDAKAPYDAYAEAKAEATAILAFGHGAEAAVKPLADIVGTTPGYAAEATIQTNIIRKAIPAAVASIAIAAGCETRLDCTSLIVNPKADNATEGWELTQGDGGASIGTLANESPVDPAGVSYSYFDGGNWGGNDWTTTFEQTVAQLPAGKYRIALMARGSENLRWYYMQLNGSDDLKVNLRHIGASDAAHYGRGWHDHILDFELAEAAPLRIAVKANAQAGQQWQSFTNFRLTQLDAQNSAIETVEAADATDENVIYDLCGRRISHIATPGIYIVNGKKVALTR